MDTIYTSDHLTIEHDVANSMLSLTWIGETTGGQFRDLATSVLTSIEATRADKIVSDNSKWRIISPNDYGWAASFWFPMAEDQGIKRLATIQSEDIFHAAAEKEIQHMADTSRMRIATFKKREDALRWVLDSANAITKQQTRKVTGG